MSVVLADKSGTWMLPECAQMNWQVSTQPRVEDPDDVAEVRTFVVKAETPNGVRAKVAEKQPGQMIRGMVKLEDGDK